MKFNYFLDRSKAPPTLPEEKLYVHEYNEFTLRLPEDWKQSITADERTLNWYSAKEKAGIAVTIDFDEVPERRWATAAEINLNGRHHVLATANEGLVTVTSREVKPCSGCGGLELVYAANTSETSYLYLGYVTSRKTFNITLTSIAGNSAVIDHYLKARPKWLRVYLP